MFVANSSPTSSDPRETSEMFRHFVVPIREQLNLVPRSSRLAGSLILAICCTIDVIFLMSQTSSKIGRQQLVMMNYTWDSSQS